MDAEPAPGAGDTPESEPSTQSSTIEIAEVIPETGTAASIATEEDIATMPTAQDTGPILPSELVATSDLVLAPEVNAALADAFKSTDPLDDPNFDTVKHINSLFPNEQSLSKLEGFMTKLRQKIRNIDGNIQNSIRGQSVTDASSETLKDAQAGMADLFARIRDIRSKAEVSERMVQEITRDIRSLDHAKKNLTSSITTLNHLKMLVGGVDSLQMLADNRQYRDAANVLSAMLNVLEHFEKYKEIGRIQQLSKRVEKIKLQLSQQINAEFRKAFRRPDPDRHTCDMDQLSEACAVLNVLEQEEQDRFRAWFVNLQLRDYRDVFNVNEEAAWIDKIDRRFAWLKRNLASYKENCTGIFPSEWHLSEVITERFLEITKDDLVKLIEARRSDLDVKLLLFAMQKSTQFEQWLVLKFPSREYIEEDLESEPSEPGGQDGAERRRGRDGDSASVRNKYQRYQDERRRQMQASSDAAQRKRRLKPNKFIGAVSGIFNGCMDVYIDAQDKTLEGMIDAFVKSIKTDGIAGSSADDAVADEAGKTLDSSGDMFRFFRECLIMCTQLHSQAAVFDLYMVFKKYLRVYCTRVLAGSLPKSSSLATVILKDGDVKLTPEEQYVTCCLLNTAEYCLETTSQLESKLKEKVAPEQRDKVDLNEEQDAFHEVISNAIQLLVRALETQCEPSLVTMSKVKWESIVEVGDTSYYVTQMGKNVATMVPFVRSSFSSDRKYFTNFCMKFVNSFIPRLITYMYKCKNVGTVGAEQLLLDMQSVKMLLLELPTIGSATARRPTSSYTRYVTKGLTGAEMILKVVMAPHEPPQLYVEDYIKLVGDDEGITQLQKILDMKGLRKSEQQPLLDAYRAISPAGGAESLAGSDRAKSGSAGSGTKAAAASSTKRSSIRKLERLMKRFQ
eukprot:m.14441 g.14441  ORF g.14441 m.14441 type:complete len:903 (-) comp10450_c0_seq1:269-2977(-)